MRFNMILKVMLSLCICFTNSYAQQPKQADYSNAILKGQWLIDSLKQAQKIPGIDVAISINGEVVWSAAFGYADLENNVPVKSGVTRFRIGSVSKTLTAAAAGKLMDLGKLHPDSAIQKYIPYFPVKKYPVTVKQVGGHLAGIRHYRGEEFLSDKKYNSVRSCLSIFENDTLLFKPGTKYFYSSYGFSLLSAVVEGVSGESFLPYMQREVFAVLGMTSTCPDKNDSIIINRTSFYQLDFRSHIRNATYVDNSNKWAGGGFLSTTSDLIRFGEAFLHAGYLTDKTLQQLTTSQVLTNGEATGYGIGWRIYNSDSLQGYGHSGGSVGGTSLLQIFPKEEVVFVFLSNLSNVRFDSVTNRIVKSFVAAKHQSQN